MNKVIYPNIESSLQELDYWNIDSQKELYSITQTEKLMKANNLGAALFAAHFLHVLGGHDPKLLFMVYHTGEKSENLIHAVAAYGSTEGFRALGKSNTGLMTNCRTPSFQKIDLADTYAKDMIHHGFMPHSWSMIYLKDTLFDWVNSEKNISGLRGELGILHQQASHPFSYRKGL